MNYIISFYVAMAIIFIVNIGVCIMKKNHLYRLLIMSLSISIPSIIYGWQREYIDEIMPYTKHWIVGLIILYILSAGFSMYKLFTEGMRHDG